MAFVSIALVCVHGMPLPILQSTGVLLLCVIGMGFVHSYLARGTRFYRLGVVLLPVACLLLSTRRLLFAFLCLVL